MNLQFIDKLKTLFSSTHNIEILEDLFDYNTDLDRDLNSWIRSQARQMVESRTDMQRAYDLLKKTYRVMARWSFDDFMTYIEWNREPSQRFWQPRRAKLKVVADALQDLEDDRLDELFVSMPPRVGKTTLMVFFIVWVMMRNSERSNLYCSYSDTIVGVFYNALMEILTDPETYDVFGAFPECKLASTDAKNNLININRRKHYASFTGRSLYGTLNGACDCNGYEIADDLHSGIEEAMNPDRLNSAWSKVDNNYLPRAKQTAKRLWIGTRWSMKDCIARRIDLVENDDKYKTLRYKIINLPALDGNDESNFEYLYNVGFNTEYYQQRRASFERNNDLASWLAQYMGEPIERDGAVFEPDGMRYFNGVLPEEEPTRVFMAVDPAWGGGDFVASPICYQYDEDIYVADVVYDNGDKRVTIPLLANAIEKHNVGAVVVEATKTTQGYTNDLSAEMKARGVSVNIQSSTKSFVGNGKQQRIFDKAPDIREHMIFVESGHRSKPYELFMQNVFSFKVIGKNKNDDAPDSLAMAVNMAFIKKNKAVIMSRPF